MQVSNQPPFTNSLSMSEKTIELSKGETYNAQIKSRLSDNEAVLQIKGKEVQVKFDHEIPTENRISVQITDVNNSEIRVKSTPPETVARPLSDNQEKLIQSLNLSTEKTEQLKKAITLLGKNNPVNKEALSQISSFLGNEKGTFESKLVAIRALVNKNLEVTNKNLVSIHEALNGEPLNDVIDSIARKMDPNFQSESVKQQDVKPNPIYQLDMGSKDLQSNIDQQKTILNNVIKEVSSLINREQDPTKVIETVKGKLLNNPFISKEDIQEVIQAVKDSEKLQGIAKNRIVNALSTIEPLFKENTDQTQYKEIQNELKQVTSQLKQEPNLQKAIQSVRETILSNSKIPTEVVRQVEQAVSEAIIQQRVGNEAAGREKLVQAITKAETEVSSLGTGKNQTVDQPKQIQDHLAQVKEQLKQEPILQKAIQTVRESIVLNPKMPTEILKQVEQAIRDASIQQLVGNESAGFDKLQKALSNAEQIVNHNTQQAVGRGQTANQIKQLINQVSDGQSIDQVRNAILETVASNKNINQEIVKQISQVMNQSEQLNEAAKKRIVSAVTELQQKISPTLPGISSEPIEEKTLPIQPKNISQAQGQIETIKQAVKHLQTEPNLEQALNLVKTEFKKNENFNAEKINKIEKAIDESLQLNNKGREIASRNHIADALSEIEQNIQQENPDVIQKSTKNESALDEQKWNNQLLAMGILSKDILVTKISQKLAETTQQFRDIKREIYRNLDSAQRLMENLKKASIPQTTKILENTINKLDHAILKSDMMLYADMRTEKQLLQASSQLAEAKKLLSKGNTSEAAKIVSEVKNMVEKIQYKPSEQKIFHYVSKESQFLEQDSPVKNLLKQAAHVGSDYRVAGEEPSPRHLYEKIRSLGLNRESDLASSLVSNIPTQEENLKSTLLKLVNGSDEGNEQLAKQAEQALHNITGQQLLSKQDPPNQLQSMVFNLPMLLGQKSENIQVFIHSKSQGEQVDWENCSLYFLLETKKLGDVGILLNATDRNLSITVKNDSEGFQSKMTPLANIAINRLQDIGYYVQNIQFTKMTTEVKGSHESANEKTPSKNAILQEKGVDLQI
ncbi:hypothetical protein [Niallia sp. 03091]|uniref:hypothetical protein n=1 Tax=unclassified Niallia TaxID=2837522 RepID=UPI0040445713